MKIWPRGSKKVWTREKCLTEFWLKVLRTKTCYIWQGAVNSNGYGTTTIGGKVCLAHRLVWQLYNGPIQDKLCVLHKCDQPRCVNIDHMFLGTRADNMKDMNQKGRWKAVRNNIQLMPSIDV